MLPSEIAKALQLEYDALKFPKLLDMLDENKIAILPAVDLSFLKENEQQLLLHEIEVTGFKVDMKKAEKLKDYSSRKKLDSDIILQIISGDFLCFLKDKSVTNINIKV